MNKIRLEKLREVVEAAPIELFHMEVFARRLDCGTAYCALGWAAINPWFRQNTEIGDLFDWDGQTLYTHEYHSGDYGRLFDIGEHDTENLFAIWLPSSEACRVTKQDVITNIDRLLRGESTISYSKEHQ